MTFWHLNKKSQNLKVQILVEKWLSLGHLLRKILFNIEKTCCKTCAQIEAFWASLKKNLVVKFFKSGLWPPGNRRNLSIHDFFFWKKYWITQKWIFEIFAFFRSNFLEKRVFPGPLVYKNHSIPSWLSYFALTSQPEWPKGKI